MLKRVFVAVSPGGFILVWGCFFVLCFLVGVPVWLIAAELGRRVEEYRQYCTYHYTYSHGNMIQQHFWDERVGKPPQGFNVKLLSIQA